MLNHPLFGRQCAVKRLGESDPIGDGIIVIEPGFFDYHTPTVEGITGECYSPHERPSVHSGKTHHTMTCGTYHNDAPTTEFMLPNRSAGDMVLKILPPAVQNVLKIPLEGEFWRKGISIHRHTGNVQPRLA